MQFHDIVLIILHLVVAFLEVIQGCYTEKRAHRRTCDVSNQKNAETLRNAAIQRNADFMRNQGIQKNISYVSTGVKVITGARRT